MRWLCFVGVRVGTTLCALQPANGNRSMQYSFVAGRGISRPSWRSTRTARRLFSPMSVATALAEDASTTTPVSEQLMQQSSWHIRPYVHATDHRPLCVMCADVCKLLS